MPIERTALVRLLGASGRAREIREASRISLREAAAELSISPGTLSLWERGVNRPSPADAERWGDLLERLTVVTAGADDAAA